MLDFGTGGLDLADEVMRGHDALVLIVACEPGSVEEMGLELTDAAEKAPSGAEGG